MPLPGGRVDEQACCAVSALRQSEHREDEGRDRRRQREDRCILGSTRPGRNGKDVADRVMTQAADREASYDAIALTDHPCPASTRPRRPPTART